MALTELDCVMHFVVTSGRTIPVSTRLSYRSDDAYAVQVAFHAEGRASVIWFLARDLLAEGTVRPSGLGDVRIRPGGAGQSGSLILELSSHDGYALLTAPVDMVKPWLDRTYQLVPAGSEGASLDLDSELSRLLGEAPDDQASTSPNCT
ncbi:SsgA family sporulation/cell division regulator [Streptomyces chartreusis]|uniref:SsgA family sporulation/cell division regulator n=1 Tax=Streptomyces chartreusis TaxID=1969 RepID=A0A7I0Y8V9_STRCX|nr:SsgA family sporulation/cell division regulator [Streptomyces chartreusis]QKZ15940.1 SsgA family sporulation/cell division regulator [Streptomyces chartreusis]